MCNSFFGILGGVREVLPKEFETTARDAAGHGQRILGPLMLIVRDNPDPLAQLCATKALALSVDPRAAEALRRVCALPTDHRHPAVRTVFGWSRERIVRDCTPRLLGHREAVYDPNFGWKRTARSAAALADAYDYAILREGTWEEVDLAEDFLKEMEGLTRELGDPDWEE